MGHPLKMVKWHEAAHAAMAKQYGMNKPTIRIDTCEDGTYVGIFFDAADEPKKLTPEQGIKVSFVGAVMDTLLAMDMPTKFDTARIANKAMLTFFGNPNRYDKDTAQAYKYACDLPNGSIEFSFSVVRYFVECAVYLRDNLEDVRAVVHKLDVAYPET